MKTFRLIANIVIAVALAAVLVGLTLIIIDERASKAKSATHPKPIVQEVPFR